MTDQYNLVDFDEKMVLYRNQTIRLVTVIMVFALVILVLNIIVLTHHPNQLSSILSISFDSVNIILSLIEWSALYMYRQTVFKILRYITPIGYALVLVAAIFQFTSKDQLAFEVEEIVEIVAAAVILIVGIIKGYKSYIYNKATIKALDDPLKRSVLSEQQYEERLKSII